MESPSDELRSDSKRIHPAAQPFPRHLRRSPSRPVGLLGARLGSLPRYSRRAPDAGSTTKRAETVTGAWLQPAHGPDSRFEHTHANAWRDEPGARGRRRARGAGRSVCSPRRPPDGHLGEPAERDVVPIGGIANVEAETPLQAVNEGDEHLVVYPSGCPPDDGARFFSRRGGGATATLARRVGSARPDQGSTAHADSAATEPRGFRSVARPTATTGVHKSRIA